MKRRATHAGSWYEDSPKILRQEIVEYLNKGSSDEKEAEKCKAVIVPHAGYRYSAPTAGYSFARLAKNNKFTRVFVLGPSHHKYTSKCEVTSCSTWETPLGDLQVDKGFDRMSKSDDETEHSLEMEMPFIAHIRSNISIVPIMVGNLSTEAEAKCGAGLAPFIASDENVFVISSDFCHWGYRFGYTYYNKNDGKIWQSIEKLDKEGCDAIISLNPKNFSTYLSNTENTICGRHAIGVLLNALELSGHKVAAKLAYYDQSSHAVRESDSSVSYAALVMNSL